MKSLQDVDFGPLIKQTIATTKVGRYLRSESLEDAFLLSIAKWHPDNSHRGVTRCGLCDWINDDEEGCLHCPFSQGFEDGCDDDNHIYRDRLRITNKDTDIDWYRHKVYAALIEAYQGYEAAE